MPTCNSTLENEGISEQPLSIGITFHHLGLILCGIFAAIATLLSLYLILQHALHYLKPWEQKHIIRILFMVPIYCVVSFLSYLWYRKALYFQVIGACYEAFAIASFFTLICNYCASNIHDQKDFFRMQVPKNWVLPINWFQKCTGGAEHGLFRIPRSGLTWFNIVWILVFQYCFIRVFFTVVSVITEAFNVYCENSISPAFAHVWVSVFEAIGVTLAMYGLIQLYVQLKTEIAEHKPILKLACIKLVIFFSFWQDLLISFASTNFQPTPTLAYQDVKVGIPSVLLCIEMSIFSVMHLFAFPWRVYSLHNFDEINAPGSGYSGRPEYHGGPLGLYAMADAFNPWDFVKATARGSRWLFVGRKNRHADISYENNRFSNEGNQPKSTIYDSTKLQPIGAGAGGRPVQLQRMSSVDSADLGDGFREDTSYRGGSAANRLMVPSPGASSTPLTPGSPTLEQVEPHPFDDRTEDQTSLLHGARPPGYSEIDARNNSTRHGSNKDGDTRGNWI